MQGQEVVPGSAGLCTSALTEECLAQGFGRAIAIEIEVQCGAGNTQALRDVRRLRLTIHHGCHGHAQRGFRHFARPAAPPPPGIEPRRVRRACAHGSVRLQTQPTPQKSQKPGGHLLSWYRSAHPDPSPPSSPHLVGARSRPVSRDAGDAARADQASTPPECPLRAGPSNTPPARDARHNDQRQESA